MRTRTAIEINYPVLVSPITMVAEALPAAKLQEEFLTKVEEMSIRSGPVVQNRLKF